MFCILAALPRVETTTFRRLRHQFGTTSAETATTTTTARYVHTAITRCRKERGGAGWDRGWMRNTFYCLCVGSVKDCSEVLRVDFGRQKTETTTTVNQRTLFPDAVVHTRKVVVGSRIGFGPT